MAEALSKEELAEIRLENDWTMPSEGHCCYHRHVARLLATIESDRERIAALEAAKQEDLTALGDDLILVNEALPDWAASAFARIIAAFVGRASHIVAVEEVLARVRELCENSAWRYEGTGKPEDEPLIVEADEILAALSAVP